MNKLRNRTVLITGGSSPLAAGVLRCVLADADYTEVWCGVHRRDVPVAHPKLRRVELRLNEDISLDGIPAPLDLVIHFAGVTHTRDEAQYWEVNYNGTMRLAESARSLGCRRFLYVSTRCAVAGSGAYGESKLAAERALLKLDWDSLLIVRPAEVYGAGQEGIDKFLRWAKQFHVVPLLWGNKELRFAPLRADDFITVCCALLAERRSGVQIVEVCGPESLSGVELALRIARRYRALPLPLWWPAVAFALHLIRGVGFSAVAPDQVARLVARKTAGESTPGAFPDVRMAGFLRE